MSRVLRVLLDLVVQRDNRVRLDHLAILEQLEERETPELQGIQVHLAQEDQLAPQDLQAQKVVQVSQDKWDHRDHLEILVELELQVQQDQLGNRDRQVRLEVKVNRVQLVNPVTKDK